MLPYLVPTTTLPWSPRRAVHHSLPAPLPPLAPHSGAELPSVVSEVPWVQPSSIGTREGHHHHATGPVCMELLTAVLWPQATCEIAVQSFTRSQEQRDPGSPREGTIPTAEDLGAAGVAAAVSDTRGSPAAPHTRAMERYCNTEVSAAASSTAEPPVLLQPSHLSKATRMKSIFARSLLKPA